MTIIESYPPIDIPEWPDLGKVSRPASFQILDVSHRDRDKVLLRYKSQQNPADNVDMYIPGDIGKVVKALLEYYRHCGNMTLEETIRALIEE